MSSAMIDWGFSWFCYARRYPLDSRVTYTMKWYECTPGNTLFLIITWYAYTIKHWMLFEYCMIGIATYTVPYRWKDTTQSARVAYSSCKSFISMSLKLSMISSRCSSVMFWKHFSLVHLQSSPVWCESNLAFFSSPRFHMCLCRFWGLGYPLVEAK